MRRWTWLSAAIPLMACAAVAQISGGSDAVALGAVINNMAKIHAANVRYQMLYSKKPCDLAQLAGGASASAEHANLLDASLASGKVGDYKYSLTCADDTADKPVSIVATPLVDGRPMFCTDRDGTVLHSSNKLDAKLCRAGPTVDIYLLALVKEYCSLTSNGMIDMAKCVASGAVPAFNKSRMVANETAAVANLRTLNTAEMMYNVDNAKFAPDLKSLGAAGSINKTLGCDTAPCEVSGYRFTIAPSSAAGYVAKAVASQPGTTGERSFCSTEDGVVRVDEKGTDVTDHDACAKLPALN